MIPIVECPLLYSVIGWVEPDCDSFICTGEEIEEAIDSNDLVDLTGLGSIGGFSVEGRPVTVASSDGTTITGPITLSGGAELTLCGLNITATPPANVLSSSGSRLTVLHSAFTGGSVSLEDSILTSFGSSWQGGSAEMGGAILATGASLVDLQWGTTFSGNEAQENGGAIYLGPNATLSTVSAGLPIQFLGNEAQESGGAIYSEGAAITIEGALFSRDPYDASGRQQARFGGAIAANGGSIWLDNSTFDDLLAESGGAIYTTDAAVDIVNTRFSNTAATQEGGAVWSEGGSHTRLSLLEICETEALEAGGSFYLSCGDTPGACVVDHIIAASPSASSGSLLYLDDGTAFVDHATVVGAASGSLLANDGDALSFRSSIVDLQPPGPLLEGPVVLDAVDDAALVDVQWMPLDVSLSGDRFLCGEASYEVRPYPGGPQMGRATSPPSGAPGLELDEIGAFGHIPEPEPEPVDTGTSTGATSTGEALLPLLLRANRDFDLDGVPWRYDCNDGDAAIHYSPEICHNQHDDDCDGLIDDLDTDCPPTSDTGEETDTETGTEKDEDTLIDDIIEMRWSGGCSTSPRSGATLLSSFAAALFALRRAKIV